MSSVQKRPDGRYRVRWRDPEGKERAKHFTRKVDAERFRSTVDADIIRGAYVDPAAGRETFRSYAEQWRTSQPHRPNTAARTLSQLSKHAYPVLGHRPIAAVRASEVQAMVTGWSATLAPGSIRTAFATVRAIFTAAVRDRVLVVDPCVGIKMPEVHRERIVPLSVEQIDALAAEMPPAYRALVIVAAGTGLRQGELFGVRTGDVNFLRRQITVARQVQPGGVGRSRTERHTARSLWATSSSTRSPHT
ncbi:MAG TPA: hypothetical protein VI011_17795 [Asanoa sp.]